MADFFSHQRLITFPLIILGYQRENLVHREERLFIIHIAILVEVLRYNYIYPSVRPQVLLLDLFRGKRDFLGP